MLDIASFTHKSRNFYFCIEVILSRRSRNFYFSTSVKMLDLKFDICYKKPLDMSVISRGFLSHYKFLLCICGNFYFCLEVGLFRISGNFYFSTFVRKMVKCYIFITISNTDYPPISEIKKSDLKSLKDHRVLCLKYFLFNIVILSTQHFDSKLFKMSFRNRNILL